MPHYVTQSPEETERVGEELAARLRSGDVVAFRGGLGAGKTAFARGVARGLGSPMGVSSPTFALVHEYRGGRLTLVHFDMYRVQSDEDLYSTGFYDYLSAPDAAMLIEWSENIEFALDMPHITVELCPLESGGRAITITGDERF